jgi:hypothetical protein
MAKRICILLLSAIVLWGGVVGAAQEKTLDDRLIVFTQELRMGLTLATVASFSPTMSDLRLHAQQLVNLLEGVDGRNFVRPAVSTELPDGLLIESAALRAGFESSPPNADADALVVRSAANVVTYLDLALSATLEGLSRRRWDDANADMLRAFAFLAAAYEKPCGAAYVPGWWTILRIYGLAARLEVSDGT